MDIFTVFINKRAASLFHHIQYNVQEVVKDG